MSWLNPGRWMIYAGLIAALWAWHWNDKRIAVNDAVAVVQAQQTAAALEASEKARAVEAELQTKVRKVSSDYQTEKKRRAADAAANAGRLSELQAAINSAGAADTAATGGTDAPFAAIAGECSGKLVLLDDYAKSLEGTASALQNYAREVCIAK